MTGSSPLSLIAAPPRVVGPRLFLQTLIGGTGSQIGWFLLGFGSIFFWGFAPNVDLSGWRFAPGAVATASGESLGYVRTGLTEGNEHYEASRIYRNLYRFQLDGKSYEGASYAKGQGVGGGAVTIEYLIGNPGISRIAGMRRRPFSPWALLVTVVPGVGLALVMGGLVKGRWRVHLLRDGLPAAGRLVSRKATGSTTMNRPDIEMTFEFTAFTGAGRATIRTNRPEPLEQEASVLILYDDANLSRALPLRSFPGSPGLDEQGQPVVSGPRAFLFLPAVTILGNALYLYLRWR